ncbi:MAG TPA: cell division protein ZapA [Longimicrobiaceae bacterium]|nr:cell division protein ZapA [Longimicrobiaceae bacterium]
MSRKRASPRHSVTVEVGGEKHVLRSDLPPEYTRAVAAHLDAVVRALPGFRTLEPHRAVLLAALAVTDELFHAREEIERLREEAEQRASAAAGLLERALGEGPSPDPPGDPAPDAGG